MSIPQTLSCTTLAHCLRPQERVSQTRAPEEGQGAGGDCPQTLALPFQDGQSQNEVRRPLEAWDSGTDSLAAPETTWAQGVGRLPFPAGLGSPLVCGSGPPSGLGQHHLLHPPPQQLDPENTGFIGADTFTGLVHSHELPLDPAKLDMLVALAQSNERGQVCYQELVDLVSAKVGGQQGRGAPGLGPHSAWLELGGQVAPLSLPPHWSRASNPVRSWADQLGMEVVGVVRCPMLRPCSPRSAASAQAALSGPSPMDSGHCPGMGC